MTLAELIHNPKKFIFVGGKGGVGKTSVSSSLAVMLAEAGYKTLLVSTDPAHSISDALDQDVSGGYEVRVNGVNGDLVALEIDSSKSGEEFQRILGQQGLLQSQNMNDENAVPNPLGGLGLEEFITDFQENTPPGLDEAMALAKVIELIENADYDVVVFDTAPTGHTLRLLNLPEFMDSFLGKLLKLRIRISNTINMFKSLFGAQTQRDDTIEKLELVKKHIVRVREILTDESTTEFIIVSIPTILSAYESERLQMSLESQGIPNRNIVINMIMPPNPSCKYCTARYESQQESLQYLRARFGALDLHEIEYQLEEVRGIDRLRNFGQLLVHSPSS